MEDVVYEEPAKNINVLLMMENPFKWKLREEVLETPCL